MGQVSFSHHIIQVNCSLRLLIHHITLIFGSFMIICQNKSFFIALQFSDPQFLFSVIPLDEMRANYLELGLLDESISFLNCLACKYDYFHLDSIIFLIQLVWHLVDFEPNLSFNSFVKFIILLLLLFFLSVLFFFSLTAVIE